MTRCAFQGKVPDSSADAMAPRTRRSALKHGDNHDNRTQSSPTVYHQLATINELEDSDILDANNQTITMAEIPHFYCQENSPCYRLDEKTGKKIYYTCVDDDTPCHETTPNFEHKVYLYLDKDYNIWVSIANHKTSHLTGGKQFILPMALFRN